MRVCKPTKNRKLERRPRNRKILTRPPTAFYRAIDWPHADSKAVQMKPLSDRRNSYKTACMRASEARQSNLAGRRCKCSLSMETGCDGDVCSWQSYKTQAHGSIDLAPPRLMDSYSLNSTWLDSTRLDSTRHVRRVEPMHLGCVDIVEQKARLARRARLCRASRSTRSTKSSSTGSTCN